MWSQSRDQNMSDTFMDAFDFDVSENRNVNRAQRLLEKRTN